MPSRLSCHGQSAPLSFTSTRRHLRSAGRRSWPGRARVPQQRGELALGRAHVPDLQRLVHAARRDDAVVVLAPVRGQHLRQRAPRRTPEQPWQADVVLLACSWHT